MAEGQQEYVVRVPNDTKKQFHVMRFNSALNVDVTKLKNCRLEREVLFKETKEQQEELPEFGAGSEYGRKEKEEARRRKFEKMKNKQNNSPWILKVGGKHGKKYRGIREGGVTENTAYYVFFQASDGVFEAFPVNEWYNFTPFQRYKALSAEEAEEKFTKRDQILNFFQLRNMAKTKTEGDKDESNKKSDRKVKKEFKVSDMDDWYDISENDELSGEDSDEDSKPKKGRKIKKERKGKRKKEDSDDGDDEPLEDSDEGDYDDKEVDYMSDLSSSSESEEEKINIKGVEDESALRDLVLSDEEEEEEKNDNQEQNEEQTKSENDKNSKPIKSEKKNGNESMSDSEFDSENSDLEDSKSALLIQKSQLKNTKLKQEIQELKLNESLKRKFDLVDSLVGSSSNAITNNNNKSNELKFKHKLENPTNEHISKKLKVRQDNGVTEEAVRRYLIRKPMTAADLVQKFKNKAPKQDPKLNASLLAEILKKINPEKQNIKGKMYFYLKPT